MVADVPVGAFLSGGIDSSAVVALMQEVARVQVKTFTIGFEFPEYDESPYAAAVAEMLDTDHTCETMTERQTLDLVEAIPRIYGEPFADPSALPTHLVSCVARKHVTVCLSGDGGDEVFGGYGRYRTVERLSASLRLLGPSARLLQPLASLLPGQAGRGAALMTLSKKELYRRLVTVFSTDEITTLMGIVPAFPEFDRMWNTNSELTVRRRAMSTDLLSYLPEGILVKVDRASMAISLETRAPFLDHRIVEFGLQLPDSFVQNKVLLKRLAYQRVSKELLERPKSGFSVPLARWFRGPLSSLLHDALSDRILDELGIENLPQIHKVLHEHASGERDHAARLWALLVLSLWWQSQRR
jgi:asparagine synthase (glutamine-hydrolysing)